MWGRVRIFAGLVIGAVLLWPGFAGAQQSPRLEPFLIVTFRSADDVGIRFAFNVQKEALRRLGYDAKLLVVPAKRASTMAEDGLADSELGRPWDYGENHPGLVRVDEPYGVIDFLAYTVNPDMNLNGWDSLRGTPLRVEFQRGMSHSRQNLQGLVPPHLLSKVNSTEQGLKRLLIGRTDVYVDTHVAVSMVMKSEDFRMFQQSEGEGRSVWIAGVMEEIGLYAWLNEKHADLARPMAEILRQMKADGTFERFAREVGASREEVRW